MHTLQIQKDDDVSKKAKEIMGDYDKVRQFFGSGKNDLVGVDRQPQTPMAADKQVPRFPIPQSSSKHQPPNGIVPSSKKQSKHGDERNVFDRINTSEKSDGAVSNHVPHAKHKERKSSSGRRSSSSDRTARSKEDRRSGSRGPDGRKPSSNPTDTETLTSSSHKPPTLQIPNRNKRDSECSVNLTSPPPPIKPLEDSPTFVKPINGIINGLPKRGKPDEVRLALKFVNFEHCF